MLVRRRYAHAGVRRSPVYIGVLCPAADERCRSSISSLVAVRLV